MIIGRKEIMVGVSLSLLMIYSSFAKAQIATEALKSLQVQPILAVSLSQQDRAVTSAFDIHVRVSNFTGSDIFIKRIQVILPPQFLAARKSNDWQKILNNFEERQLTPGSEQLVSFSIPQENIYWFGPILKFQLLSFLPNEYDARIVVSYKVPPAHDSSVQEIKKISIEPPLASIMWGGVLGSLLLALFLGTYRFLRRTAKRRLWQEVKEAFVLFLAGSICAIIAILLLYRFKELPLPVNINVNDFYGAIVIGLFTYKLGDWLFDQFFGKTEQTIKEEEKNKS